MKYHMISIGRQKAKGNHLSFNDNLSHESIVIIIDMYC